MYIFYIAYYYKKNHREWKNMMMLMMSCVIINGSVPYIEERSLIDRLKKTKISILNI